LETIGEQEKCKRERVRVEEQEGLPTRGEGSNVAEGEKGGTNTGDMRRKAIRELRSVDKGDERGWLASSGDEGKSAGARIRGLCSVIEIGH